VPRIGGRVRSVSADALIEERSGTSYYLAKVQVDRDQLAEAAPGLELTPGMPAEVFIATTERTVLEYFLQPITQTFARTFRESWAYDPFLGLFLQNLLHTTRIEQGINSAQGPPLGAITTQAQYKPPLYRTFAPETHENGIVNVGLKWRPAIDDVTVFGGSPATDDTRHDQVEPNVLLPAAIDWRFLVELSLNPASFDFIHSDNALLSNAASILLTKVGGAWLMSGGLKWSPPMAQTQR
jgi:hypothetical protein